MRAILTYHSIDASGSVISMNPEIFRSHMDWLASSTVRVVPLSEIAGVSPHADAVALTFDDGFVNFETDALPELERWAFPATVFVVSGQVGKTNRWSVCTEDGLPEFPLMDWDGVARAAERGVEIGAHTTTHPWLPGLDSDRIEDELQTSAETLEQETGKPVRSFAYPYGGISDSVVGHCREVFDRACTTTLRPLRDREDPFLLPRLDAYYFRAPDALEGWGKRAFRWRLRVRAGARRLRAIASPGDRPAGPAAAGAGQTRRGRA